MIYNKRGVIRREEWYLFVHDPLDWTIKVPAFFRVLAINSPYLSFLSLSA